MNEGYFLSLWVTGGGGEKRGGIKARDKKLANNPSLEL
jgi:hypothetical protein